MTVAKMIEQTMTSGGPPCVCWNLRAAARAVTQVYEDTLRPSGIRATQFGLLAAILALEPVTISALAATTATDRTTLGRNLKLLEGDGLVTLEAGADRRERVVRLTERGRKGLEQAYTLWEKAQKRILERFGGKRWQALRLELEALAGLAAG
jgi:DNA-binding MarR family transcriptional regulator